MVAKNPRDTYGIGNTRGKIVAKGFSREESLSYIGCEGQPGEFIIQKWRNRWYRTDTGVQMAEYRKRHREAVQNNYYVSPKVVDFSIQ